MWVVFRKAKAGLAYFKGDKANLSDEMAKQLIEDGFVLPADADQIKSDLPLDLPGRAALIKEGLFTKSQVLDTKESLTDVPGIGSVTAKQIIDTLTKGE